MAEWVTLLGVSSILTLREKKIKIPRNPPAPFPEVLEEYTAMPSSITAAKFIMIDKLTRTLCSCFFPPLKGQYVDVLGPNIFHVNYLQFGLMLTENLTET